MKTLLTKNQLSIVIFIVVLVTTFISYTFKATEYHFSSIWPSIGIAVGIFTMFRKKMILQVILGIFMGRILGQFFIFGDAFLQSSMFALFFTLVNVLQIHIYTYIMDKSKQLGGINYNSFLFTMISFILMSAIGGLLSTSFLVLVDSSIAFQSTFTAWAFGDFIGLLIFGLTSLLTFYYDIIPETKKLIYGFVFLSLFVLISTILFAEVFDISYTRFSYVFIFLFLSAAFYFSYRMIISMAFIFLISFHMFFVGTVSSLEIDQVTSDLNFFLFALVLISMIVRMLFYETEKRNQELKDSNIKLNELITSTNKLFVIRDQEIGNKENNIQYLKSIFQIALSVFDSFDRASCYINVDGDPVFIDSLEYDIDMLNKIDFSNNFKWALRAPEHIVNAEVFIQERLGYDYKKYNLEVPPLKESIRFGIYIDDKFSGGMSFDITVNSDKKFTKEDYKTFSAFQNLMNSFYEVNFLSNKNINLKNDLIISLVKSLELFDQYTSGHSEEVAEISKEIAIRIGLSESQIYNVYWAGIVHDIGKLGLKREVLNKKGKLTDEEFNEVKKHPEFGANVLITSDDLKELSILVRHHHEWWNGRGYPDGLKESSIPLEAQILCVSDSVSAMMGQRPYSGSMTANEIVDELKKNSGTQFSPNISKVMIDIIQDGFLEKFN